MKDRYAPHPWPEEHLDLLRRCAPEMTALQVTAKLQALDSSLSESIVRKKARALGVKFKRSPRCRDEWPPKILDWLRRNYKLYDLAGLTDRLNAIFMVNYSRSRVAAAAKKRGYRDRPKYKKLWSHDAIDLLYTLAPENPNYKEVAHELNRLLCTKRFNESAVKKEMAKRKIRPCFDRLCYAEIARMLDVDDSTVRDWCVRNEIPSLKRGTRRYLAMEDVERVKAALKRPEDTVTLLQAGAIIGLSRNATRVRVVKGELTGYRYLRETLVSIESIEKLLIGRGMTRLQARQLMYRHGARTPFAS